MADLSTRKTIYVSPAYEQIYGRPAKALYRNSYDWLEAIHPDDRIQPIKQIQLNLFGERSLERSAKTVM